MTVLVTGASGFLGTAVVRGLLANGESPVRCFVRPSSHIGSLESLRHQYPHSPLEYVTGNLVSSTDVSRALVGVTTVYHLAAQTRGAPASIFLNTVIASKRLIDGILLARPKRVILVSSLAVYGTSRLTGKAVIDETADLEQRPEKRDVYTQAKLRQELLFREYQDKAGFELAILRPGVIYGRGGPEFSARVGLVINGWLFHFGGHNLLPLTYVDNCAAAVISLGNSGNVPQGVYNMVDDDLPTATEYLHGYRLHVGKIHSVRFPFCITRLLSALVEQYSVRSRGQIPPMLTPYKSAAVWKEHKYDNARIKSIGWQQRVSTNAALLETFAYLKSRKIGCEPAQSPSGGCTIDSPASSTELRVDAA